MKKKASQKKKRVLKNGQKKLDAPNKSTKPNNAKSLEKPQRRKFLKKTLVAGSALSLGKATLLASKKAKAQSANPFESRVVRIFDARATNWDFTTGYYWQHVGAQDVINDMVDLGVRTLTGASSTQAAWNQLLPTYTAGHLVTIKVNTNDMNWGAEAFINMLPEVVNGVINGLKSINVPENRIRVWDAKRPQGGGMLARWVSGIQSVYPGVTVYGPNESNFNTGALGGNVSAGPSQDRLANHLIEGDHLIAIPIVKAINDFCYISGALKLHVGSIVSGHHGSNSGDLGYATSASGNMLVAVNSNPHIRNKLRLIVGDFLFGMYSGRHFTDNNNGRDDIPNPWQTFGNKAPNSLLFSTDPVAIDSVMLDYVEAERSQRGLPTNYNFSHIRLCGSAGLGIFERKGVSGYSTIEFVERDGSLSDDKTPPSPPSGLRVQKV